MYLDIHCHLDLLKAPEEAIKKAISSKVKVILTAGIDKETNRKALSLSERFPEVKAALGIYPIDSLKMSNSEIDKEISFIRENREKVTAIGEVGLDYKESYEKDKQKLVFEKFISLSLELNKPLVVHSRKAEEDAINLLEEKKAKKVIMHCFSGKHSLVERARNLGFYFSIPGNVKNSEHFQKIVRDTEITQLLCETDSPFLHPDKLPENEPSNVLESYKKIAEIKKLNLKDVEKAIYENYLLLFNHD